MEARHWSIAIPAFRATTDVDPPRLTTRYCKTTATSPHRPSPCTSSPRRCHKTSAFPAAAPKDRTDSAPHANRAARRTAAAAHTNRHYQQAAIRSRAGIHSSSPRAVHIQAPHDQNCHSRPRRARLGSTAMQNRARAQPKASVPQAHRPSPATAAYPAYRTDRAPSARRTPGDCGPFAPHARHSEPQPDAPTETHWHPPTDRSANRARKHRRQKQKAHTRSRRRKRGRKGDSSAFRSR